MSVDRQEPRIVRRHRGGYLAISSAQPRIGVAAETEEEARSKFHSTMGRWLEILAGDQRPPAIPEFADLSRPA